MFLDDSRNILDIVDPDSNHYADNIINFNSYTPESLCGTIDTKGSLNIYHHNVRSILAEGKKEEIDQLLVKQKILFIYWHLLKLD